MKITIRWDGHDHVVEADTVPRIGDSFCLKGEKTARRIVGVNWGAASADGERAVPTIAATVQLGPRYAE